MDDKLTLDDVREEITAIDRTIMEAFYRRQVIAEAVYSLKASTGKPILDSVREEEKLSEFPDARTLMQTLMRLSRGKQYALALADQADWRIGRLIQCAHERMPLCHVVVVPETSHPYSLDIASKLFPAARLVDVSAPESACRRVREESADAAILPLSCCDTSTMHDIFRLIDRYHLYIAAVKCLSDQDGRAMRFAVVSRELVVLPNAEHLSLIVHFEHRPDALANVLNIFADLAFPLIRVEMRGPKHAERLSLPGG